MIRKTVTLISPVLVIVAFLVLAGCSPRGEVVVPEASTPSPAVPTPGGAVDNPDVFVDPAVFQEALLSALNSGDTEKLRAWMTEPVLTGTWRLDQAEVTGEDALKLLQASQLGAQRNLALVKDVHMSLLMGGVDPLTIPSSDSGVQNAFLVSGWGQDGEDEAILFISRDAADNLKWHGWLQVKGGFSGARLGGIQPYQSEAYGFSLYVPKEDQVSEQTAQITILAPGEGEPGSTRAAAFIMIEPANGRTAEEIVEGIKTEMGSGFNIYVEYRLNIEGETALSVKGIPAQDPNRMLFIVHNDVLYRTMFWTDDPQAPSYQQMDDMFWMVVNTFHFTK